VPELLGKAVGDDGQLMIVRAAPYFFMAASFGVCYWIIFQSSW
jgi:hypothetical protein